MKPYGRPYAIYEDQLLRRVRAAYLVFMLGVVALLVWVPFGVSSGPTIYDKCSAKGGVMAVQSHGKSHTYYCIRGNRVVFVN